MKVQIAIKELIGKYRLKANPMHLKRRLSNLGPQTYFMVENPIIKEKPYTMFSQVKHYSLKDVATSLH